MSAGDDAAGTEDLEGLRARLNGLEGAPVGTHPSVLDEVHRALVGELDSLARRAGPPAGAPPGQA